MLWAQVEHYQIPDSSRSQEQLALPAGPILLANLMLWCGLLSTLDFAAGSAPNVLFLAASFTCFYFLLGSATAPLKRCAEHHHARAMAAAASENEAVAHRSLAVRFKLSRLYVIATWLSFPTVWMLGAFGLVSSDGREGLFMLCDFLAKFLPVSVYLSLLAL